MVTRRGASKLGCLLVLVIIGTIGYFGFNVSKHYIRNYQLRETMESQARFAAQRSDSTIRRMIQFKVDSLGLPEEARNIRVKRANGVIFIYTEYSVTIEFPYFVKRMYFSPQVQAPF